MNWLSVLYPLFSILAFQSSINGYLYHEDSFELNENSTTVEAFHIKTLEKSTTGAFPKSIQIHLKAFGQDRKLKFDRLSKYSKRHPISNNDVYKYDVASDKIVRNDQIDSEGLDHAFYHDRDDTCVATLIKSDDGSFKMLSTCVFDNHFYHIVPIKESSKRRRRDARQNKKFNIHGIVKKSVDLDGVIDYIKVDSDLKNEKPKVEYLKRAKRQSGTPVNAVVELLVVTDYSTLLDHKRNTGIEDQAVLIKYMRIYFAHLINNVNLAYINSFANDNDLRVSVKIKNFLFATSNEESIWTNKDNVGVAGTPTYNNREVIVSDNTLSALADFLSAKTLSFTYDHAAGISNKDFWSASKTLDADKRSMNCGLAYMSRTCNEKFKFSINEDTGLFNGIGTIAHELGHNLGADHDGEGGIYANCPTNDGYIMTPVSKTGPNSYKFSSCSIQAMKNYILSNGALSNDASCLSQASASSENIPEQSLVSQAYPGQSWTADDQCKNLYNKFASFCQSFSSNVCEKLYCRVSGKTEVCSTIGGAVQGTTCDSGKICINGECVQNSVAPTGDCVFGDDASVRIYSSIPQSSCESFIEASLSSSKFTRNDCITNSQTKKRCCKTCKIYSLMTCLDAYNNCETDLKQYCSTDASIKDSCKKSCGVCQAKVTCESSSSLCENGGSCQNKATDSVIGFECLCKEGYSGNLCQFKNPCLPNPCTDGKSCVKLGSGGYFCN